MHQRAQHHGGIGDAAGEHDVGAGIQRCLDRQGAQVGVHGDRHGGQRGAAVQFGHLGKVVAAGIQVVAFYQGDLHFHARGGKRFLQGIAAGTGVYAPGVADHLDVFRLDVLGQRGHHIGDKVVGIACTGVFHPCPGHDRQGHLGQVVEHQVIQLGLVNQLEGSAVGIAPESGGTTDANRL